MCTELTLCARDPSRTSSAQDDGGFGFDDGSVLDFDKLASFARLDSRGGCPHVSLEGYDYDCCGYG